jgi:dipeptidyl aminopeptidase/acylaminoacyl peptidase
MLIFSAHGQQVSEVDGIYTVNSNGIGLNQVLSRTQIESIIGAKYASASYISYNNQGYINSDKGLYAITDNWQFESKVDIKNGYAGGFIGFSPDGKQILYYGTDNYLYISSIDGLETHKLIGGRDSFSGWSADGSMVYFWKNGGRSMGAINADGSNYHELSLTALENYTPYEGLPLPSDLNSYYRRFDAYAVSTDKKQVAFTLLDLLFVADATDLEFSNPRLILRLHGSDAESEAYGFPIIWSPDNNSILIELNKFNNSIMSWETDKLILANVTEGKTETVSTSFQFSYDLCGFSPDGSQIIFTSFDSTAKKSIIMLEKLGDSSQTTLVDLAGWVSCPVWQFSGGQK